MRIRRPDDRDKRETTAGMRTIACSILILCGAGCFPWNETEFVDEGAVCTSPDGSEGEQGLEVRVLFHHCLSSNCSRVLEAHCEMEVVDDVIHLTSRGLVERKDGSCNDDCNYMDATCVSEPLPPGEYTLVHGDDSVSVTLPPDDLERSENSDQGSDCIEP